MARSELKANTQMLRAISGQTGPQVPEAAIALAWLAQAKMI